MKAVRAEENEQSREHRAELRKEAEDLTRLMLYYHVCRVQLEGGRDDFHQESRTLMRVAATQARIAGFRRMRELQEAGVGVRDYDDNTLRIEAIKLAYELRRQDVERAMNREAHVVAALVVETLGEITLTPPPPPPQQPLLLLLQPPLLVLPERGGDEGGGGRSDEEEISVHETTTAVAAASIAA